VAELYVIYSPYAKRHTSSLLFYKLIALIVMSLKTIFGFISKLM